MKIAVLVHLNGPALWPEEMAPNNEPVGYSEEFLLNVRDGGALSAEKWEALYQQSPVPPGGNIWKEEWWQKYDNLPRRQAAIITIDTAVSEKKTADYTVFALWVRDANNHAYLVDVFRKQVAFPEACYNLHLFYKKWRHLRPKLYIENKSSGQSIHQQLTKHFFYKHPETGEVFDFPPIPLILYKIPRGLRAEQSGPERMRVCTEWAQAGFIHIPAENRWIDTWIMEHSRAPKGEHDDTVITTVMMIEIWYTYPEHPDLPDMKFREGKRRSKRKKYIERMEEKEEEEEYERWLEKGFDPKIGAFLKVPTGG